MTQLESFAHIAAAAALAAGMISVGFGALGAVRRGMSQLRPIWLFAGAGGAAFALYVANAELRWSGLGGQTIVWIGATLLVGLIVGGLLLRSGLRGRWVGDHEHCRRCGFDLFGRPAGARVCNECGSPLDAPRAIVVGVRHRRPVPLVAGAFLIVAGLAIGASAGRATLAGGGRLSLIGYKPTRWLMRDATSNSTDGYEAAREIVRRATAGSLSDADVRAIAAAAASTLAQTYANYYDLEVAEAGWTRGVVDEATMRQILRRQAVVGMYFAPVTPGLPRLPYAMQLMSPLGMRRSASATWTVVASERVDRIGDRALPPRAIERSSVVEAAFGVPQLAAPLGNLYRLDAPLAQGQTVVTVTMNLTITLAVPGRTPLSETVPVQAGGVVTVDDADADTTPILRDDDGYWAAALGTPTNAVVRAAVDGWTPIDFLSGPVGPDFAGDAYALDERGHETRLGEALLIDGVGRIYAPTGVVPAGPFAIVLRPFAVRPREASLPGQLNGHVLRIDASRVTRLPAAR